MVNPHFVHEHTVRTHGQDLNPELLEIIMLLGDRRDFGSSDKGEVTGIKAEHDPLAEVVRKLDRGEFIVEIGWS